ncbi:MAG: hypothetical protein Q9170_006325 [Blastenia crenularia]
MTEFSELMKDNLLGNPHSESPSSSLATHYVETARHRMLRFFRADPEHFDLIFVANATAAIKMVAEGVRDENLWVGYHGDAHTSLVGLRQLANLGNRCFLSDSEVEQWLAQGPELQMSEKSKGGQRPMGLFAYPGQSNMNGRRLPLDWAGRIRRSAARSNSQMFTLFDAAALVASTQLDLSDHVNAPDFTALSFYKIFGFPDLGCLIVRKESGHVLLKRSYFGGGTVDMVINGALGDAWHATRQTSLHEALEDGTGAFHSIAALHCAVDVHTRLFGSMTQVSQHANHLASVLYDQMAGLTHRNGRTVCTIYKSRTANYKDRKSQGPTIAFNIRDVHGRWIGKSNFEHLAMKYGIQLRTGGVCNPGGIALYLNLTAAELRENFEEGLRCGNGIDEMHGKPTGIVRVSFGAMSSMREVETFLNLLTVLIDKESSWEGLQRPEDSEGHSGHSGQSTGSSQSEKMTNMSEKQDFGNRSLNHKASTGNFYQQQDMTMQSQSRLPPRKRDALRRLMCF